MNKPEWFKMDPAKFLCDAQVDGMSTLELGACFRLLCRQWIDGFIPADLHLLARLCRLDDGTMEEAWVTLSRFFPEVEPGKRANRFMWIERDKVIADLERKSDEGTRAARKRWDDAKKKRDASPNGSPMLGAMQDQTRPEQTRPEQTRQDRNPSSEQQTSSDTVNTPTQRKTDKQPSHTGVPCEWVSSEAWSGFVEMRKKLRKPLTDRAVSLIVSKLRNFREAGDDPEAVLDQSTRNGWLDVYPIKGRESNGNTNRAERRKVANIAAGDEAIAIIASRMAN